MQGRLPREDKSAPAGCLLIPTLTLFEFNGHISSFSVASCFSDGCSAIGSRSIVSLTNLSERSGSYMLWLFILLSIAVLKMFHMDMMGIAAQEWGRKERTQVLSLFFLFPSLCCFTGTSCNQLSQNRASTAVALGRQFFVYGLVFFFPAFYSSPTCVEISKSAFRACAAAILSE